MCWHLTSGATRRDTLGPKRMMRSAEGFVRSSLELVFIRFMEMYNIVISHVIHFCTRHMTCSKQPGPARPSVGTWPNPPLHLHLITSPEDDICEPGRPVPTSQHRADCKCYRGCQVESIFVSDMGLPVLSKQCNAGKPNSGLPC